MCMMHNQAGAAGLPGNNAHAAGDTILQPEKPLTMGMGRKVYSVHNHVGQLPPWAFYESEEPISPADPGPETPEELDFFMSCRGIEKTLIIPNYGIPVQEQPFSHNSLVADLAEKRRRTVAGALWVSGLPRNRELTDAALQMLDQPGILAMKMSYLLGGTADPSKWDEPTLRQHEAIFRAAIERDLPIHFHTSPGGGSDITGFFEIIKRWGKDLKIHLVHMGGGVSGHIRLLSQWKDLIEGGYQVYIDTSWAIGFAVRKLLQELDRTGIGLDRVMFGCDEPWSDFESEFWKIQGAQVSDEIKERIFWGNAEEHYFSKLA
ncbi:amidohydrolase family protein [Paenibacillus sp. R14(2021)]|uniref:amidohydrolase family protein n=1 Tax=Paenibacillus sp. R14(2021) TaxID=2859228 RepID=UPI002156FBC3|nr:amidohydrolase [Paenibacillus sp. R14(2021)]